MEEEDLDMRGEQDKLELQTRKPGRPLPKLLSVCHRRRERKKRVRFSLRGGEIVHIPLEIRSMLEALFVEGGRQAAGRRRVTVVWPWPATREERRRERRGSPEIQEDRERSQLPASKFSTVKEAITREAAGGVVGGGKPEARR